MPNRPLAPTPDRWPDRLLVQTSLALTCALLSLITAFVPDWIEHLLGFSPDDGSGEMEWGIVLAFAVASATCSWFARNEWRRWKSLPASLPTR